METIEIKPFKVIGISITTTNENNQAAQDIGKLWGRFETENIFEKIPGKVDFEVLSIYTNYQGDYTKPYDNIIGCRVDSLDNIPEGFFGQAFMGGRYNKISCRGNIMEGIVAKTWGEIWNKNLERAYSADFEVYGQKAQNLEDAEVDIFVAIN